LRAGKLAEFKVLYLFGDGIAEKLHLGQAAVLVAWSTWINVTSSAQRPS